MEIIAHRGASGYAPENTVAAFKKAVCMGAKSVEFDVQMTKDGQLVVIHDYSLDRTTTGAGMVMETTYDELKELDAGSWYSREFAGEKVPLLSEVLSVFPSDMTINIEIKKATLETRQVELDVYQLVKDMHLLDQVIFSSFDHQCLKKLLNIEGIRVGVLISSAMIEPITYLMKNGLNNYSLNQNADFIDETFVKNAHAKGLKVFSYTVNTKKIGQYFESIGVDGIFTNYPDLLND